MDGEGCLPPQGTLLASPPRHRPPHTDSREVLPSVLGAGPLAMSTSPGESGQGGREGDW